MPSGRFKSRRYRRVYTRVPSGKVVIHYRERKPKIAHCAICGKPLLGVPRVKATELSRMSKTEKRPERPYGGVLCSECMRKLMKEKARMIE